MVPQSQSHKHRSRTAHGFFFCARLPRAQPSDEHEHRERGVRGLRVQRGESQAQQAEGGALEHSVRPLEKRRGGEVGLGAAGAAGEVVHQRGPLRA